MRIGILGSLSVRAGGGQIDIGGARLRALLIRLAVDAGRQVTVDALADALWERPPTDRANAVQSLVYRLRRTLPDPTVLRRDVVGYRLDLPPEAVDATRFEQMAAQGRAALRSGEPEAACAVLGEALDLWRGPALADVVDARYAVAAATRLEELRLSAVEDWLDAGVAVGNGRSLVPRLDELTATHPLRERPVVLLMKALYAAGRRAEAVAAFARFRGRLADELGMDPSPELRDLHLAMLRGDLLVTDRTRRRGNLRAAFTSFVGRETERALLTRQLAANRLVTVVGPAGVGKSRLAATVAADLAGPAVAGGVWLVRLDTVTRPAGVVPAVLETVVGTRHWPAEAAGWPVMPLGTPADRPEPPADHLASAADLGQRLAALFAREPALLLLDSCEHLLHPAAELVNELLSRCPRLRILATSRESLRLLGENLCPLSPLGVPDPESPAAVALRYPAVRLFADRAAAARPGFEVDATTIARVVEICRRLDGLPLAIELAAARLRTLPLARVAAGLGDRLRLLSGGSRAAVARHRSLAASLDWTWDLLDDHERVLARRLAVFPDEITVAAAEAACGDASLPAAAVADLLDRLAGRSVLQVDGGDTARYRMLETMRAYAWNRLCAAGEDTVISVAHATRAAPLAYAPTGLGGLGPAQGAQVRRR